MNEHTQTPSDGTLPAGLTMDAVTLRVGDLEMMSDYYAKSIGLTPIEERPSATRCTACSVAATLRW